MNKLDALIVKWEGGEPIDHNELIRLLIDHRRTMIEMEWLNTDESLTAIERGIDPKMFSTPDKVHQHCSPRSVESWRTDLRFKALRVIMELFMAHVRR